MIETHPFGIFIPKNPKYLLLGSFTTKEANFDPSYDWFYGTGRNQFWKILRIVYNLPLENKQHKQELFSNLHMALGDIIQSCERLKNSNLDVNLVNIVYNLGGVEDLLKNNKIETVFFSSKFVESSFRRKFKYLVEAYPEMKLIALPSPSPRFASMNFDEKVNRYKSLLPKLV